jgi:hypothetical protein
MGPPAPVFTSTPGTAASEGVLYSYPVTATDPAGGTVTFMLASAPTGATLNGSTLSWTPAAAQSRISNGFSVTATTSSGGTARQSWTVAPTGTVTVNMINTNWTPTGPQNSFGGFPVLAAIVPNPDGSETVLDAILTGQGVFSIPTVPGGYYWLVTGIDVQHIIDAFWTSSSTVDLGRDIPGPVIPVTTEQSTTFNFNIAGLDPTSNSSTVAVFTDFAPNVAPGFSLIPAPESTTASWSTIADTIVDWSQVDTVVLTQYEPASLGLLNSQTLGPALTISNPGFIDGGVNNITKTLQSSPPASLNVSVPGSQWALLFNTVGPATPMPVGSWLSASAEPFISGRNQSPNPFALNFPLVTAPQPIFGSQLLPDFCLNGSTDPLGIPGPEPAILTDENFGTLNYGDPFPSSWTRAVAFCPVVFIPIPVAGSPGTSFPFPFIYGVAVPSSSSPSLAPLAQPVRNPTVNGINLFTENTINTTVVTLSWSAPQGATPFGYRINVFLQTPLQSGVSLSGVGAFGTAKTSATLPPLTAGKSYVFTITTLVDGAANMETTPWRSALPTGYANVVSAPVTINSGAMTPAIHGDAELFAKLSQRKGKTVTFPSHPALGAR